jgi:type II secretory pathway pseudopilin PulG
MKQPSIQKKGFSLLETILYLALIVIMLGALVPVMLQIVDAGAKSSLDQEVDSVARYASERIIYEIRNAQNLNVASSSFGTNFAASSTALLSLAESSTAVNPTTFSVASGTLYVAQGTSTPVSLTPSSTSVSSLIFTNNSTSTFNNVSFVLVLIDSSPSVREEFQATTTIEGTAELRGK